MVQAGYDAAAAAAADDDDDDDDDDECVYVCSQRVAAVGQAVVRQ